MQEKAVKAERMRDLRSQVAEIGSDNMPEVQFQLISTGREPVTVYSTKDGSPTSVPAYMLGAVMALQEDGKYRFVADKKDAPEYKLGNVKCFLHPDSPERPILDMVGLTAATCPKDSLASEHSKRLHGLHRHKQEWAAYQEFVENEKEEKREARQDSQLEATLSIARGGQAAPSDTELLDKTSEKVWRDPEKVVRAVRREDPSWRTRKGECDICGKTGLKRVKAHKSMVHKEV